MKTASIISACVAIIGFAGVANADDVRCPTGFGRNSISAEQAIGKAESLGYAVIEAKRSKGCWKIEGFDRNGAEIEISFDPGSGEVVKPRNWRRPSGN